MFSFYKNSHIFLFDKCLGDKNANWCGQLEWSTPVELYTKWLEMSTNIYNSRPIQCTIFSWSIYTCWAKKKKEREEVETRRKQIA